MNALLPTDKDAPCQVERGCALREGSERAKVAAAQAAAGRGPAAEWGQGHARSRTVNIWYMLVTLDVSRLSGWLNAVADCRVKREAYYEDDMEGQKTGGRGSGSPNNVQGGPDW
eukprot:scaffold38171_cov50-Phaeocystis_antarctica.AAC.1